MREIQPFRIPVCGSNTSPLPNPYMLPQLKSIPLHPHPSRDNFNLQPCTSIQAPIANRHTDTSRGSSYPEMGDVFPYSSTQEMNPNPASRMTTPPPPDNSNGRHETRLETTFDHTPRPPPSPPTQFATRWRSMLLWVLQLFLIQE